MLSDVRLVSPQPCSPSRAGDFCVLRPARHTRVCLRGRVLHKSPRPRRFRPAGISPERSESPKAMLWQGCGETSRVGIPGRVRAGRAGYRARPGLLVVAPARRRPAPAPSVGGTRRDTASSGFRLPCLACVPPRLPRTDRRRLAQLLLVSPPVPHAQSLVRLLLWSLSLAARFPRSSVACHIHYRAFVGENPYIRHVQRPKTPKLRGPTDCGDCS